MLPTSKLELFQYQPETINEVRQYFNVDEKKIQQNIEILKNWLKQQKHLPHTVDDAFLERMLLRNKFRIEQTKEKLDSYFSVRGLYFREIFKDVTKIVPSKEIGKIIVLPKLTESNERILFLKKSSTDMINAIRQTFFMCQICELSLFNDYSIGDHFVFDLKNYTLNNLTAWTASRLLQFWKLYMIKIHDNLDSLYECIPKNLLPSDLGGDLKSLNELEQQMDVVFDQQQEFFEQISQQISNEKLRIGALSYNDLFGVEGSLKKLEID